MSTSARERTRSEQRQAGVGKCGCLEGGGQGQRLGARWVHRSQGKAGTQSPRPPVGGWTLRPGEAARLEDMSLTDEAWVSGRSWSWSVSGSVT